MDGQELRVTVGGKNNGSSGSISKVKGRPSTRAARALPVIGHADDAVLLRDDDRRAHNILESLDFAEQAWLPSLRPGLVFARHGWVVCGPPSAVLPPGNITHDGPAVRLRGREPLASCQSAGGTRCCD